MDRNNLLGKLSAFNGHKRMLIADQDVYDIMGAMLKAHQQYAKEYDKISEQFYRGNAESSAKAIFDFLKRNVKYTIDSGSSQRIMSPSAIIALGKNDCKNYALFIAGILQSLKRKGLIKNDSFFRFASYKLLDEIPHHVFVVMINDDGNEIYIDPVLNSFDQKKMYYHKIDKKLNMPIYAISGIGATTKAAPAPKKKKRIVVKIALAPARGSFLLLVGLNFLGIATKLNKSFSDNAGKTRNWWETLGGNANELLRKTEQGAKKKKLLGSELDDYVGVIPVAAGAAAATAAPILIKLAEFLKSLGVDPKEIADAGKKLLGDKIKQVVNNQLQKSEDAQLQQQEQVESVVQTSEGSQSTFVKYLPYVIGGILVIYFVSKKRGK